MATYALPFLDFRFLVHTYRYYITLEDRIGYTEVWGVSSDGDGIQASVLVSDVRSPGRAATMDKAQLARVLTGEDDEFAGDISLRAPRFVEGGLP